VPGGRLSTNRTQPTADSLKRPRRSLVVARVPVLGRPGQRGALTGFASFARVGAIADDKNTSSKGERMNRKTPLRCSWPSWVSRRTPPARHSRRREKRTSPTGKSSPESNQVESPGLDCPISDRARGRSVRTVGPTPCYGSSDMAGSCSRADTLTRSERRHGKSVVLQLQGSAAAVHSRRSFDARLSGRTAFTFSRRCRPRRSDDRRTYVFTGKRLLAFDSSARSLLQLHRQDGRCCA